MTSRNNWRMGTVATVSAALLCGACAPASGDESVTEDTGATTGADTGATTGADTGATTGADTGEPTGADPGEPTSGTTAEPAMVPRFEPGPCPQPLAPGLLEGGNLECGSLLVHADRTTMDQEIALAVTIVRGSDTPVADPIVHLLGGPGGSTQSLQTVLGGPFGLGMAEQTGRDFIVFDQRGTGASQPFLACGEAEQVTDCIDRLAGEGIDLADYNTEASADDVEDLRLALGYPQINLYGQSYGTELAQAVLRRHPGSVRSVVLESTSSVAYGVFRTSSGPSLQWALSRVFSECAADPGCAAAFPDPAGELATVLQALADADVDPAQFVQPLYFLTSFADGTSHVPLFIHAAATGDVETVSGIGAIVEEKAGLLTFALTGFSALMNAAIDCYDYSPLYTQANYDAAHAEISPVFESVLSTDPQTSNALCGLLPASQVSAEHLQPVTSAVPVLMLIGTHDSNTPAELAEAVAANFADARVVRMPGWGHLILSLQEPCALTTVAGFIQDPKSPTPKCVDALATTFPTSL